MAKKIALLISLFLLSGCATISHVVNSPPDATDLYYTQEDVEDVILRLSQSEPPDDVTFDGENYIVGEDTMNKLVTKGVIEEVQKKKIREFVSKYKRDTFMGELKKDAGTGLLLLILITAGMLAL